MADAKSPLTGLTSAELESLVVEMGEKRFRGRQIAERIYRQAVQKLEEIPELPEAFRSLLAERHSISPLEIADHKRSSDDVDKLLVHRGDGQVYECVLLPYKDRVSCCLSSQVGCPMGCTFCATGMGGYERNLDTSEIVSQYLLLQSISERRIGHVVFMGMGEPLLNLDNLLGAIGLLHDEVGLSHRRITVSTVGLVPQIRKLAEIGLPIHLALSIHSPFDETRSRLMPVNNRWNVEETIDAMRDWHRATGRKVTFEYLMIKGVNDSVADANRLSELIRGLPNVVNLIPFNYVDTGYGYSRPTRSSIEKFRHALESKGVNVTERVERGHDIDAACGQLAGRHKGTFARRAGGSDLQSLPLS